jgi:hypothetical protein
MKNKKDVLQDIPEDTNDETIASEEPGVDDVDETLPLDEEVPVEEDVIDEPIPEPPKSSQPPVFSFERIATGMIPKSAPKNELQDLFEVPKPEDNDMYTDDLFDVPEEDLGEEDNLDDLTKVSREDVMGRPPKRRVRYQRTNRPYNNQSTMGSIQ